MYYVQREESEILGSGSDIRDVLSTNSLEDAVKALKIGRGNRLVKYKRIDGRLRTFIYDYTEKAFIGPNGEVEEL